MYNGLKIIFAFTAGAAVGSVVAWKLLEKKYQQRSDEEIESAREAYARRLDEIHEAFDVVVEGGKDDSVNVEREFVDYEALSKRYKSDTENNKKGDSDMELKPYVITPEEFGEDEDYETVTLTYYADGVLTDDENIPIENVDYVVGLDSLTHFGEYEDDSVFVRNEELKGEYEILLDVRTYAESITKPNPMDDE